MARLLLCMSGASTLFAGYGASAGPWSTEPKFGVSTDYSTDPELIAAVNHSETHVAAMLELPIQYDTDSAHLALIPRTRYSDSRGYSSLASNYLHLDATAQFMNELGSFALLGELARDSSLYPSSEIAAGIGVRRDTASGDIQWQRNLTERSALQLDLTWIRVKYDQSSGQSSLVDNRNISAAPAVTFALTERDTVKILSSVGRYQSLNGFTQSKDMNLQLGWDRQLNEVWTLSSSAGYSRSINSYEFFFGSVEFGQKGEIYAVSLTRRGESFIFTAGASRALQPTGFAFLSRQDSINLSTTYTYSERWSFGANGVWQKSRDPLINGSDTHRSYYNAQLTADWHWTPEWVLSLRATRAGQRYGLPSVGAASSGISFEMYRQFLRIEL